MSYLTVILDNYHRKSEFYCGKAMLDDYLHKQAGQDMKRSLCVVFVLEDGEHKIKGYYSLSNNSIPRDLVPEEIAKKLPKAYHTIPATLMGRLAVDKSFQGQGVGEILLLDALKRCFDLSNESLGSIAVIVDPLDDQAVSFYKKYGFIVLPDSGKMFLPMGTIKKLFEGIEKK